MGALNEQTEKLLPSDQLDRNHKRLTHPAGNILHTKEINEPFPKRDKETKLIRLTKQSVNRMNAYLYSEKLK